MFNHTIENGILTCAFTGRQDTLTCTRWQPDFKNILDTFEGNIIFDMTEVDYICSLFLRICLETAKNLNTKSFRIINTTDNVKKVFEVAGFDNMMDIG